jgi:hypothetical protein
MTYVSATIGVNNFSLTQRSTTKINGTDLHIVQKVHLDQISFFGIVE